MRYFPHDCRLALTTVLEFQRSPMKISQLQTTVELVKRNNTTRMLARIAS